MMELVIVIMIKRIPLSLRTLAPLCLLALNIPVWAQPQANEKAQRYYDSLLKRPVPGAAFDRFYGAWLDTETLESLEKWLSAKADAPNAPAGARLLLAYFYSRQSEPQKAIAQFSKVLAADPANADAWYQKAMASARLLDSAAALKDLEKAAQARPSKLLAAQIRQAQGRLLARQGQPGEARKVWQELLAASPGDEDLAEDLIDLQMAEGLYDDALATTQKLLADTRDAYKKVQRRLRLGEIYLKSGKRDEAVRVWRSCLDDTGSDSWLEKEILSQLEQAFRREDAVDPLMREMADLAAKYPQRLTLRRHYAKLLAETGHLDGAVKTYQGILELAPGERSVREGFIDLLKDNKRLSEAVAQLRELARLNPGDLELLARLADLQSDSGDKAGAKASMELFLTKSDQGEAAWLRVAAALERYGMKGDALAQYQRTAEKFPDSPSARGAWAVALHAQGEKEKAFGVWRELVKGADAAGLATVARAAAARGEHALAFELLKAREPEFARDPVFLALLCDEASEVDKPEEALPWALKLVRMSRDAVELEGAVSRCLRLADKAEKTDELRAQLQAGALTAQEKCLLAELLDRHADPRRADALLKEVAAAEPELATAALVRLQGQRNDFAGAADSLKRLIESPGGRKSVHVQRLVELYRRAGRAEEALAWIPEWKKLSPGSVLPWQTEAELQSDAGKGKEALRALRQASQEFPDNEDIRAQLASAYRGEGQLADAQRIYMALYESAADTAARIRWAGVLAEVAKEAGKTEDLIETFEQRHKANRASPAPLLALAEIHRVMDNYEGRRKALMEAVRVKPGDAGLLMEIARVAEQEEKYDDALETLREAAPLDKTGKVRRMITRVLFEAGREEEGMKGLRELFTGPPDATAVENVADSLVAQDLWGQAADFLLDQLPDFPDNYRLHYYCAVALEQEGRLGAEFDPAGVSGKSTEPGTAADGQSGTTPVDRKTGAVDLFLKVRGMTKELPVSALPVLPGSVQGNRTGPDFYAELAKVAPPKAVEILRLGQTSSMAYQYRQRGGRSRMPGGLAVPPQLDTVRSMALAHLLAVSGGLPEEGRTRLISALAAEGLPQPRWLMDAGVVQPSGGFRQPDYSEPLEKEPDSEVLHTLQVLAATGNARIIDAQLLKAQAVLQPRWPVMAQMAGLALIRGELPEEQAAFAKTVDELSTQEEAPGLILMNGVNQALNKINNRRGFSIPDVNRAKFASLRSRILPWLRADSVQRQNSGYIFLQLAAGLAEGGDLTSLVQMLDGEIAYWTSDPDRKSAMMRLPSSGPNQTPPVAQELTFPPARLPDFPPQVLQVLNGQGLRMQGLTLANDPAQWKEALKAARDPVLRVLVANAADDRETVGKEVRALASAPAPTAGALMLAAALEGQEEHYPEAVGWLRKAWELPVSREVRRTMDSAVLAWSLKVIESNAQLPEDDPVRLAGREAALRMRRENLNAGQRSELADAFETLGLKREAERMAAVMANSSAPGPRGMTSSMMMSGARNRSQIQTLLDKGKREEAVKSALRQLRDQARDWISGTDGSVRYLAQEWLQDVRRGSLTRELQEALREETKDDASSLALRAAAWDILGESKTAVPLYRKALELRPKDAGVQTALALALLPGDPKEAIGLISRMDVVQFTEMMNVLQNMMDQVNTLESRFSLLEVVEAILGRMTPEQALRQDMSVSVHLLENVMQQGKNGEDSLQIGSLYESNPEETEEGGQEEDNSGGNNGNRIAETVEGKARIEALRQRRLKLHDSVCRRMMRLPGLADPAFRRFAGVALAQNLTSPAPEELDTLAMEVLKVEARQRGSGQNSGRRYYYSNNQAIRMPSPVDWLLERAWRAQDPRMVTERLAPALRQQGGDGMREMELQAALYFCPDTDFQKTVGAYLKRHQSGQQQSGGEPITHLAAALRIMNLRGLQADLTAALVESVKALNSNYFGGQELTPVLDYAEYLMETSGEPAAHAFLSRISAVALGPEAKRQDFLTKNYQPRNGFNSPAGMMVYRWIQMLRTGLNRPLLVLPMFVQAEEELVPYLSREETAGQPVLHHYGSAFQRRNSIPEKPEAFLKFIKNTPLTADAAGFRSYPDPRQATQSPVVELLKQLSQHPKRTGLTPALEGLPKTFGTDLLRSVLGRGDSDDAADLVAKVLGAHLAEIQALPPERWADFVVLRKGFGPGGDPDAAVKAFDEWSKNLDSRTSAADVEKLLTAKDAGTLAAGDSQMTAWLQPPLAAVLTSGDPRGADALIKARVLVEGTRRARGVTQLSYNDGSSMLGQVLGSVLNKPLVIPDAEKAARTVAAVLQGLTSAEGFPVEWSSRISSGFDHLLTSAVIKTENGGKTTRFKAFAEAAKLNGQTHAPLFGPVRRLLSRSDVTLSPEDQAWLDAAGPDAGGVLGTILVARPPVTADAGDGKDSTQAPAEAWLRARMADATLPLPVRLGLAADGLRSLKEPAWPTTAAAVALLTENWRSGQPVTAADAVLILDQFNGMLAQEDGKAVPETAKPLAADLSAAWRKTLAEATRGPGSYGYRPMPVQRSEFNRSLLTLFLTLRDANSLNTLLNAMGPQVDRGWLALIVAGGQEEIARRLAVPMRPQILAPGNHNVKFSKSLADHLPGFLAGITDERARILTEALLVSLPDPGAPLPADPKRRSRANNQPKASPADEAKAVDGMKGVPDRLARMSALLDRLPLEAFKTRTDLEPLVTLYAAEESLAEKAAPLLNRYVEGDSLAAASLVDDANQRELRCGILSKELLRRLKAGDVPKVEETLRELDDSLTGNQTYYSRQEAGKLYPLMHALITSSWSSWPTETRMRIRNLWLSLSLDTDPGQAAATESMESSRAAMALFLYALEDDMKAFVSLTSSRPAAVRKEFAARLEAAPLTDVLNAVKYPWSGGSAEISAAKTRVLLRMISQQPFVLPGSRSSHFAYFRHLIPSGWITAEDIAANAGTLRAQNTPQPEDLAAELAAFQIQEGQGPWETAARNLETAQSRIAADDLLSLAKLTLLRTRLLEKQGRAAEALTLLTAYKVPDALPPLVRREFERRLPELKTLAALQSGGPEKLIAEFTASLTEKPQDAEEWTRLAGALSLSGQQLMNQDRPAEAAHYFGMASVIIGKLAAREPGKYTQQLHAPAKKWQEAAKAANLPGAPRTLVPAGGAWKYTLTPPAAEHWRQPAFDDQSWKSGEAPIGYGEPWLKTDLSTGPDKAKPFTLWLRREFATRDTAGRLTLELMRDDGAAVYLNGKEIARSNLPTEDPQPNTPASSTVQDDEAERKYHSLVVKTKALLVPGRNVLAVEVHQDQANSADLTFDLALHADQLEPWEAVQKLDPAILASALGKVWTQLPAAFRDAVVMPAISPGGSSGADSK